MHGAPRKIDHAGKPMPKAAEIDLVSVSKMYGTTTAVENISLKIPAGTYCCLLGPSGCGKTSTLRMIAGHESISRGDVRLGDAVARIGGDEFGVLLPEAGSREAELIACRILDGLAEPLLIEGQTLRPTASIGIALAPDDGTSVDELLHAADLAMYAVKASGGGYRFADSTHDRGPRPIFLHGVQPS